MLTSINGLLCGFIFFRQGAICQAGGILEIWGNNETIINSLTDQQVLNDINKQPLIR